MARWCHMVTQNSVTIGSGNGLLPEGTKPLPEPMLTNHQWGLMAFTSRQFHWKCTRFEFENNYFKITAASPRGQWVKSANNVFLQTGSLLTFQVSLYHVTAFCFMDKRHFSLGYLSCRENRITDACLIEHFHAKRIMPEHWKHNLWFTGKLSLTCQ